MFKKILIANRGEIACRVIKTARAMGIATVAVYSDADQHALHVRLADEAVRIGPAASRESYLRGDIILEAAKQTGAEAIHPGYGFLSENADFAEACAKAGIVFIGPSSYSINAMGLKDKAKEIMQAAGVPIVPGYMGDNQKPDFLQKQADSIGYPVLIKAVAGGGGKGMRRVDHAKDFADSLQSCQREAKASFGNDHVLIEKYIAKPRHIEVQVFGDNHGNAVYLFERDCSLQRRHQKVVEEAPAPDMPEAMRKAMGEAAVKAAKAIKYSGAGTIEFIVDVSQGLKADQFYFMEMNTRLQVEHPVTEMITGVDLVEWQLRVAHGEKLPMKQEQLSIDGHAFEVRLYAEDPANNFLPQIGKISAFTVGLDDGVRVDTGIGAGDEVSIHYDPMIAKLIVHGPNRAAAIHKMAEALASLTLAGLNTNQEFLGNVFRHAAFIAGDVDTGFIGRYEGELIPADYGRPHAPELALVAAGVMAPEPENVLDVWSAGDNWRLNGVLTKTISLISRGEQKNVAVTCRGDEFSVNVDGAPVRVSRDMIENANIVTRGHDLTLFRNGRVIPLHLYVPGENEEGAGEGRIIAPMPGKIISVMVKTGASVTKDQPLLIMEAMKMEMTIKAGCAGIVGELPVSAGQQVQDGALLVAIEQKDAA
ncbi:MAG: acetyl/propionyl/methylcrotonyl-CoA carboxylase subunit alpha [Micavibrio sp.]